jgi:hypothetical protein
MERFVFNPKSRLRLSTVTAVLSGIAIYFFGAPMITLVLVALAQGIAFDQVQGWYRKHRPQ